jgi:hypothetical protein
MTEQAWTICCFWVSVVEEASMPWVTYSGHPDEQQAREAAHRVFEAYRDLGPVTVEAVEIRGPRGDWQPLLSAASDLPELGRTRNVGPAQRRSPMPVDHVGAPTG